MDGQVLLDRQLDDRIHHPHFPLPASNRQFIIEGQPPGGVLECVGNFNRLVFADLLPDASWARMGRGVSLDIIPVVSNEPGLRGLIYQLADLGWVSSEARWNIQQAGRNWHGIGCAEFVNELPRWQQRVNTPQAHHSEQVSYFDRFDGGCYSLTANIEARDQRDVNMVAVSFQLEGVPLDTAPLMQLCKTVGVYDELYFRPGMKGPSRATSSYFDFGARGADVQPLGFIVKTEGQFDFRTGVVIANPFRSGELKSDLRGMCEMDQILCELQSHHIVGTGGLTYRLVDCTYVMTSDALVCRAVVRWD